MFPRYVRIENPSTNIAVVPGCNLPFCHRGPQFGSHKGCHYMNVHVNM
ncbi:hypothetical protein EDC26_10770 [Paralcaligenes ureilyticus]|uniref:Uncharacterized protein n=1 Tax=Paralcaligenes ureilyticus TaxID=627131 RepID=A0A4R3M6V6_9BURK|nr:hypothetical protein EDC26_10770 [Paralcaligenes ureilyticus]